ncbi:transcriptional regulator [Anaerotignum propionicum]|uniref:transcriptional regulator n=1 Tax=Anaerotignum propionicum TaxID=28446 RepID=UPI002899BC12|nr:transcriptional regulator [Anaerotignum propionicum]
MKKYPQAFNFIKKVGREGATEIKTEIDRMGKYVFDSGIERGYKNIDLTKFCDDIDIHKTINIINWALLSFALYCNHQKSPYLSSASCQSFFNGISQFFSYVFDGRTNQIIQCVFDLLSEVEHNRYKIIMYMNFPDYNRYQHCENTYCGYIEHYDAVTNIELVNQYMPMEKASVQILASHLDSDTKWGLWNGLSSRPMMPIATKKLFSKILLKQDALLLKQLKISKEDIRLIRLYNMLSVT